MNKPQSMPENFAEIARGRSGNSLRAEFKIGSETCRAWLIAVGLECQTRPLRTAGLRVVPDGFVDVAEVMTDNALGRRFKASNPTITRWRRETGLMQRGAPRHPKSRRACPADFEDLAPTMTVTRLAEHYKTSTDLIRRWSAETGARPRASTYRYGPPTAPTVGREVSLIGFAVEHLQRFYVPVHRADILPPDERKALTDGGRGMFVVGRKGALPAAEVIALAERRGFDPHAWARI